MNAPSRRTTALLSAVALGLTLFSTASVAGSAPAEAATTAEKDPGQKSAQEVGYDCGHARIWSFPRVKPGLSPVCKVLRVYDEQKYGGPVKLMGEVLKNCSDIPGAQGYSRSETITQSFSIGLNPGLGLGKAINLDFGWETSTSQSTEISSTAYMPAMGVGWITYQAPMLRGGYEIEATYYNPTSYGYKTVKVNGAVTRPQKQENLSSGWVARSRAMTDTELSGSCGPRGFNNQSSAAEDLAPAGPLTPMTEVPSTDLASPAQQATPSPEQAVEQNALTVGQNTLQTAEQGAAPAVNPFTQASAKAAAWPKYGPDFRFWAGSQGRWMNSYSSFCLSNDGAASKQRACTYPIDKSQAFKTVPATDGYYSLRNTGTGKCLSDPTKSGSSATKGVAEAPCNVKDLSQHWSVNPIDLQLPPFADYQRGYSFSNRKNGLCLALDFNDLLKDRGRVVFQNCP